MADVEEDRGGKGKERGIGERRAFFSPLPPLTPFFVTATQAMGFMDVQENIGVVLR